MDKKKKKAEVPLAELKLRRSSLGMQIQRLEQQQWDVAWKIAQYECPVKVGQILRKAGVNRRYRVLEICPQSVAAMTEIVTWALRVRAINKDGALRCRSRVERFYCRGYNREYSIETATRKTRKPRKGDNLG